MRPWPNISLARTPDHFHDSGVPHRDDFRDFGKPATSKIKSM